MSPSAPISIAALVVAGGRGARAGGAGPKQYRSVCGLPCLTRTLATFLAHPAVDAVLTVIHSDDEGLFAIARRALPAPGARKLLPPVHGGQSRQGSVLRGLAALEARSPRLVLVHDGARPFVGPGLIERAIAAAERTGAAVPGCGLSDTVKVVDERGRVVATPERGSLRAVQTPQGFDFGLLLRLHREAESKGQLSFTDDAALVEQAGLPVEVFDGELDNVKLTYPADFDAAERRLRGDMTLVSRVGSGFDVHAFSGGDHLWLAGVRVPHERGVAAHSDGDVVLHALTDALLGVLADGDIGVHFPPSDERWRGASSDRFLAFAAERVRAARGTIDHLDVTLLCETPRLGPHRDAMRHRIAEIAGVPVEKVALKATTTEKLGFLGRGEGIAAQALATVRLPDAAR